MSDLDPRARAIVDAGRTADLPSRADHDRIKRAVLLQIAAGTAVAGTAAAGTLSLGAKAGLAVLAVALVGGGAVGVMKLQHRPSSPAPRAHLAPSGRGTPAPAPPAGLPAEPPAPAALVAPPSSEETITIRKVESARKAIAASTKAGRAAELDQLNAEVEVLKRAREELRQQRPVRALDALGEYDRRFGKGVLVEERQAMAAIAACQATPGPAARAQAEAFVRQAPASPLRERVREACITPRPGVSP
jgi:hypothetical protein